MCPLIWSLRLWAASSKAFQIFSQSLCKYMNSEKEFKPRNYTKAKFSIIVPKAFFAGEMDKWFLYIPIARNLGKCSLNSASVWFARKERIRRGIFKRNFKVRFLCIYQLSPAPTEISGNSPTALSKRKVTTVCTVFQIPPKYLKSDTSSKGFEKQLQHFLTCSKRSLKIVSQNNVWAAK